MRSSFREQVETTQNPFVQSTRAVADTIVGETGLAVAVRDMQRFDSEFDISELPFEGEEIFREFYEAFLVGDLEYLQKFCGEAALAVVKSELKRREVEGWVPKFKEPLEVGGGSLLGGMIPEKRPP